MTDLKAYMPIWNDLTPGEQEALSAAAVMRKAKKGELLHSGSDDCVGLFIIVAGRLRVYTISPGGREVTLYRLFERDICLFSASCMMNSVQFDVFIEAEKESDLIVIPAQVYKNVMKTNAAAANYANELMATRFSDVMWLVENVLWHSMDSRIAAFLISESEVEESDTLSLTHDMIARHMGTAREVVSRMLKYFSSEGYVSLSRGTVKLQNKEALISLAGERE